MLWRPIRTELEEEFSEWFPLLMSGAFPAEVTPLSAEQRQIHTSILALTLQSKRGQ